MMLKRPWSIALLAVLAIVCNPNAFGQADQGTITGVVQDPTGAVIGNANVTLTNLDTGQVLKARADGGGVYVFSPIKIGRYSVTGSAQGFETTTQANLHLSIQQRLNIVITLKPGSTSETVTVTTEAPLMQTQESSVGQTMDTETINNVPLAGRNWVYIAQLSAGTAVADGSRGGGKGDFEANGQRAEENNFILDGVDNNANVVDFYNGASFVAQPPPDALAEFKVQTGDYSAEFGHSAGAVVNASIKSGTNNLHGSAWEYLRNTAFDVHDWNPNGYAPVPAYHENQFGATLGGPVIKNKLFLFGDAQANRIAFHEQNTLSVPSAKMRLGDLSELLNPNLSGNSSTQLYYQTPSAPPQAIPNNCLVTSSSCTAQIPGMVVNQTALKMLSDYPQPNANGSKIYNNYIPNRPIVDNTFQWDVRADWNVGSKDTTYSRYSYWNQVGYKTPPLGSILDGGGFGDDGKQKIYGANFMWSETHVFSQSLTNEARFGFNYLHTGFQHPNANNPNFASSVGFGGIPNTGPLIGGLPQVNLNANNQSNAVSNFGSPGWSTTDEHENVFQIIDNVTKIAGNHALKAGVVFENIRFSTLQPQNPRGNYSYNGNYTQNLNPDGSPVPNTGLGLADFLLDLQNNAGLSNEVTNGDQRADNAAYFQDDWRVNQKLTLNLGLRWEFFQPYQDVGGYQAAFVPDPSSLKFNTNTGTASGSAQYLIPKETYAYALSIMNSGSYSPNYATVLAEDNITPVSVSDPHLLKAQHTNFAPRIGIAYSPDAKMAVRAGFGIFYGGLESLGYWPNLGENYPFQVTGNIYSTGSCTANHCPTDGITIGNGFSAILAKGFASNTTGLTMRGAEAAPKTAYTEDYNLSVERSMSNDMVATVSYVGNTSRHLPINVDANSPLALANGGVSSNSMRPFVHSGGTANVVQTAMSDYNSLQAKLEKRMAHGYNLLATYTWSHALDDANTPLGSTGDNGQQNYNLIPIKNDYAQSPFDTRQRFTFNGLYELPFGKGRAYMHDSVILDEILGGWSANATFTAQSGNFFTVYPTGLSGASGTGTRAVKTGSPFSTGGTATVANQTCATSVKTAKQWYNPCAFTNPWAADSSSAHYIAPGTYITDTATALKYAGGRRNQIPGPGYERVNMSIFKSFKTFREQNLDFRADIFNLFNTPALANPSNTGIAGSNPGQITGLRSIGVYQPNSRFMQLSLRYAF
ncbi:MAG TPA: carboxypeptidase regulatory-like domain-containing protein [Terracidiphilus sp.]|nr:carboxypeptidase regulatory-like domain-containing protein [Terracidiphilus sp.]